MNRTVWMAAALLGFATPMFAATLAVPTDYATINAAVTAAADGDVIAIGKGRYLENVNTGKSLTFQGKKGTIWDGFFGAAHHDHLVAVANNVVVKGIEFQNGNTAIQITGDNVQVIGCTFNGSDDGVSVTGANVTVSNNLFRGLQLSSLTIVIVGPGAIVDKNVVVNGYAAYIDIDAQGGGATVTNNLMDTNQYYARLGVANAVAPLIQNNQILNTYADDYVIDIDTCDDAVVSGNTVANINYDVDGGIYVSGARATVTKNKLEMLNGYSNNIVGIQVVGADAEIIQNTVWNCGSGNDYDTWGIRVTGANAVVTKNIVQELSGGGDETVGIEVTGDDAAVDGNTVRNLNDEYATGIYIVGNRGMARKNKVSNVLYYPLLWVAGDDFLIEGNTLMNSAYGADGIYAEGNATVPGAAAIRKNKLNNINNNGIYLSGSDVIIEGNKLKRIAYYGINVTGNGNVLNKNNVLETYTDAFYINGNSNRLTACTAINSSRDGFDIDGDANTLNKCKATNCAAEGLDNGGGTNTTATYCTLKGSRIDYAGNSTMADDTGTTYQTGGPDVAPEIN